MTATSSQPEPRSLVITWEDQAPLREGRALAGIEALRRVAAGELPRPAVASLLGWDDLSEFEAGRVVASFLPEERHYSPLGVVHGGVAMSLLDTAMTMSAFSILLPGESCVAVGLKVQFVRVIVRDLGRLRCEGAVLHREGDLVETRGTIVDEHGRPYAHGTGVCRVTRA